MGWSWARDLQLSFSLSCCVEAVGIADGDFVADAYVSQSAKLQAVAQERLHGTWLATVVANEITCVARDAH